MKNSLLLLAAPLSPPATPFADLMLNTDKLEFALLATHETRNGNGQRNANPARKSAPPALKTVPFQFSAPVAMSVQLAADFTDWEKTPLDMIKSADGNWFMAVPLAPGQYAYRFIVDGQWCDDPCSARYVANPFGSVNAVKEVPI